ncbi:MAG: FtsX-like permease family protein [Bacteroidota bacterium]
MLLLKLAFRNIIGAGLRTWLNAAALSFAFVTIIFLQGVYTGMNDQVEKATISTIYGGGQYWHQHYDPYDPLSLTDAHGLVPAEVQSYIDQRSATPIMIRQGSIYPGGRFRNILLKGIDPRQSILIIPSSVLSAKDGIIPGMIGTRMAKHTGLKLNDLITVQWRTAHGTFDAREVTIVHIFKSTVQEIDNDQIWIPLSVLQQITELPGEATMVVMKTGITAFPPVDGWNFKNLDFLLMDLHSMVKFKSMGGSIFYTILMLLAMLAIFDTQVLSIWHRRKEMGTLMALGMTRTQLIGLFTMEGAFHGIFAALVGAIYGIPLLTSVERNGWALPQSTDNFGFAFGDKIFPTYSAGLILGTAALVLVVTTIVSFLPTKRIATLKPTDALRGKMT